MSNSNQIANNIASLLMQNPNFDLRTFNFLDQDKSAVKSINWEGVDSS
ncbi:hypothetical protein [Okeania sp. KiyG1]|nr:hypothetical protein [Okeania sp. KiyG1]